MLSILAFFLHLLVWLRQVVDDPTSLSFFGMIALLAVPGVLGWLWTFIYGGLKTVWPWYDKLDARVHQIATPILGWLFSAYVVHKLGFAPIEGVSGVTQAWFIGGMSALVNGGIFRYLKRKSPVDATLALETTRKSKAA